MLRASSSARAASRSPSGPYTSSSGPRASSVETTIGKSVSRHRARFGAIARNTSSVSGNAISEPRLCGRTASGSRSPAVARKSPLASGGTSRREASMRAGQNATRKSAAFAL